MQVPKAIPESLLFSFASLFVIALSLAGCGGKFTPSYNPVTTVPAASVDVTLSPSTVSPGQSATLTWKSQNATSCTGRGAWSGVQAMSGSTTVILQGSEPQTYTLQCSGSGLPAESTATLAVAPGAGACSVIASVRARIGRRAVHGRKPAGIPTIGQR